MLAQYYLLFYEDNKFNYIFLSFYMIQLTQTNIISKKLQNAILINNLINLYNINNK